MEEYYCASTNVLTANGSADAEGYGNENNTVYNPMHSLLYHHGEGAVKYLLRRETYVS